MKECHLCGRPAVASCSVCSKTICSIHAEDSTRFSSSAICSTCFHKKRLKRIQLLVIICFLLMVVAIIISLIFMNQFFLGVG